MSQLSERLVSFMFTQAFTSDEEDEQEKNQVEENADTGDRRRPKQANTLLSSYCCLRSITFFVVQRNFEGDYLLYVLCS